MKVLKGWLLPVALLAGVGAAFWVARERPDLLARLKSGSAVKEAGEALRDAPRAVRDSVHEHYLHWHDWWGRYGWHYPAWVIVEQGAAPARSEPAQGQAAPQARVEPGARIDPRVEPRVEPEARVEPRLEPAERPRRDERPALGQGFQAAPAPGIRAAPGLGRRVPPSGPCERIGLAEPAC